MNRASESKRIDLEAAAWLVKRDRGFTAVEQDEFHHWLSSDPRHGEWLARHQGTWGEFDQLAQWRPEHSVEPNPDLLARPHARRFGRLPLTLAVAAAVALSFALWGPLSRDRREQANLSGPEIAQHYERRTLADGSMVELNRGAALHVQFSPTERRITLMGGEAHFTVAPDAQRPFVVHTQGVDVRALGTAFNVRIDRSSVEVLVTHGRVRLTQPVGPSPADGRSRDARDNRDRPPASGGGATKELPELTAGDRAIVSLDAPALPQITRITPAEIAQALAWQPPQMLDFSSTPLGAVIDELNRRNRAQLVLADEELRSIPIVAAIRSDNVDGFVRFLESTVGLQSEARGIDEIVLRRRR